MFWVLLCSVVFSRQCCVFHSICRRRRLACFCIRCILVGFMVFCVCDILSYFLGVCYVTVLCDSSEFPVDLLSDVFGYAVAFEH